MSKSIREEELERENEELKKLLSASSSFFDLYKEEKEKNKNLEEVVKDFSKEKERFEKEAEKYKKEKDEYLEKYKKEKDEYLSQLIGLKVQADSYKNTIKKCKDTIKSYEELIERLKENFDIEKFISYAPKSEKVKLREELEETKRDENNIEDQDLGASPEIEEKRYKKRWGRQEGVKTRGRDMSFKNNLETTEIILDKAKEKGVNSDDLLLISKQEHNQIDFVRSYFRCRKTTTFIYKDIKTGKLIVATPKEHDIINGGKLTNSFIAAYVTDRIIWGTPYYREAKRINTICGFDTVNAQLLTRTSLQVSAFLETLGEKLLSTLKERKSLHADETRLLVIHSDEENKKKLGYFWMLSSLGKNPISYAKFFPSRKAECAKELLSDIKGAALQTDGYSAYASVVKEMNELYAEEIRKEEGEEEAENFLNDSKALIKDGILLVGCMAHARRRFYKCYSALYNSSYKSPGGETCSRVLKLIKELYELENELKDLKEEDEEAFLRKRKERALPIVQELKAYVTRRAPLHSKEPKLTEAITYLLNQIDIIANYLESPDLTPDNNSQERLIKTICLTRKNSLFATTEEGARSWANLHSILQTAVLNNLNPTDYLKTLLDKVAEANYLGIKEKDMDWDSLLPWNIKLK